MKTNMQKIKNFTARIKKNKTIAVYLTVAVICLLLSSCTQNKKLTVESADGSRIAYGVKGQGDTTLIFVHGWLCSHKVWQSQIDHFSKNYKVAWLDLAGHGDSETSRQKFTMPAFAGDVKSVYDKVGGQKVILIGHSMGGAIVIETAKLLGEKVIGLVAVDSFYTALATVPEKVKLAYIKSLKKDYVNTLKKDVNSMFTKNADPDLIDSTYKNMLAPDHRVGVSALYELIKWNSKNEQSELKNFAGKLYNINAAPTSREKKSNKSVVLISGTGHFVTQAKPDEFNSALETVIKQMKIR